MTIEQIIKYLREYNGTELRIMEVCGSHTAAISKYGIKDILSPKIKLISGPGCPVCVTPTDYIDKLIELSLRPDYCVATFGDMLRVPGSKMSLLEANPLGAHTKMIYSPMELIAMAKDNPKITYVFAAVGFETTAPVYTLLLDEIIKEDIRNIKLLTAIKTMPQVISWLLENNAEIHGFIAPGHVCAITGSTYFEELSDKYKIPFAISGFSDKELLIAIYGLVRSLENGHHNVSNYYTSIVENAPNDVAFAKLDKYFEPKAATWRGIGSIEDSGLYLKSGYACYDAGSLGLDKDNRINKGCCCGEILMGKMEPAKCPLFGKICTPDSPQGACMVSYEGSCFQQFSN